MTERYEQPAKEKFASCRKRRYLNSSVCDYQEPSEKTMRLINPSTKQFKLNEIVNLPPSLSPSSASSSKLELTPELFMRLKSMKLLRETQHRRLKMSASSSIRI
ncbi:hypothetical protein HDE_01708 [Halotydeus destructor]|nr:hypothetical protein HDE_01708 [Halotydeus destructor]